MGSTLYIVATPIGNLEDITLRALRVLREEVDRIACEDTRQTLKLLNHFGIAKPLISYHEHNESSRTEEILALLRNGESIALVSDAGTPLISDPGFRIVRAAIDQNIKVVSLPGASALLTALASAGLPTDTFQFVGFLPPKQGARRKALLAIQDAASTTVLYESPHRIIETLTDIANLLGDRPLVLGRELTKLHEEFLRGTAQTVRAELETRPSIKGEITIVIGQSEGLITTEDPVDEIRRLEIELNMDRMAAIKLVAKQRGLPKSRIYQEVVAKLGRTVGRSEAKRSPKD